MKRSLIIFAVFVSILFAPKFSNASFKGGFFELKPDSPFYFLDLLFDKLALSFAKDAVTRATILKNIANERWLEYKYLKHNDPDKAEKFKRKELLNSLRDLDSELVKINEEDIYNKESLKRDLMSFAPLDELSKELDELDLLHFRYLSVFLEKEEDVPILNLDEELANMMDEIDSFDNSDKLDSSEIKLSDKKKEKSQSESPESRRDTSKGAKSKEYTQGDNKKTQDESMYDLSGKEEDLSELDSIFDELDQDLNF